jgi:hypothetical protein
MKLAGATPHRVRIALEPSVIRRAVVVETSPLLTDRSSEAQTAESRVWIVSVEREQDRQLATQWIRLPFVGARAG